MEITRNTQIWRTLLITAVWIGYGLAVAQAQSITWLGTFGGSISEARGVSDNGLCAGMAHNEYGHRHAFRWNAGLMEDLGLLPSGGLAFSYDISADGSMVVGWATIAGGVKRAFLWSSTAQMIELGTLGGSWSEATGVSSTPDPVIVGRSRHSTGLVYGFRWTATDGITPLIPYSGLPSHGIAPDILSEVWSVSEDGLVAVGWSGDDSSYNPRHAAIWSYPQGNAHLLEPANIGIVESEALGTSADGSVIVGRASNEDLQKHAFIYAGSGMQDLGTLGGSWSEAWDVSADGETVVGWSRDANGQNRAFRWTASGGMENLTNVYSNLLGPGSLLSYAYAISPNGRYIVGQGYNAVTGRQEAYLLDTDTGEIPGDVNGDGCVDDADLLSVLFAFGNTGGMEDLNSDGVVDDADLLEVLFHFGSGC
jgi:probable HAF family extracellular repeat protein